MPAGLAHLLREANVVDSELHGIHTKLKERTTSQMISYLHLAWINLQQSSIENNGFMQQLQAHRQRTNYVQLSEDRVLELQNDGRKIN